MRARVLFLTAASILLVGCDHATKHWAESSLDDGSLNVWPGVLNLTYIRNYDVAFNLLQDIPETTKGPILLGFGVLAVTFLALWWWQRRQAPLSEQLAHALLLAGALGNVIDRAFRGYVVDFIHLAHWPVFNLADVLLVLGMGLMILPRRRVAPQRPA